MMNLRAFEGDEHQPFFFEGTVDAAVLLTHGFPGSAKEMRPIAEVLNRMGFAVRGVLLPGFGPEIETITERNADEWYSTVESALLDLKGSYSIVLLAGNSMGGGLSIQAAAKQGADGLILFAPFWTIDNILWKALPILKYVVPRFKPFKIFKPDFNDPEFQKGTRNFMPDADFDDPEFRRGTLELEVHTHVFDQIRAVGATAYQLAPQFAVPTLVIQGTEDELVTPRSTEKLLQRLGGDLIYKQVKAPHNPLQPELECWHEVVESVQSFANPFVTERA